MQSQVEIRDKVADFCPICNRVRVFIIRDHHNLHSSLIPSGTVKRCKICHVESRCWRSDFLEILPKDEEIDLEDLLRETNPKLAAHFLSPTGKKISKDAFLVLELKYAVQSPESKKLSETAYERLCQSIEEYENRGAIYDRLRAKLNEWHDLDDEARARLAFKVDRFLETRRVEELLIEIAPTFPESWGYYFATAVFISGIVSMFLFVGALLLSGAHAVLAAGAAGIFYGPLVLTIVSINSYHLCIWWQLRQWVHGSLIPRMEEEGRDFERLADVLEDRDSFRELETPDLARMRKYRVKIVKFLVKADKVE